MSKSRNCSLRLDQRKKQIDCGAAAVKSINGVGGGQVDGGGASGRSQEADQGGGGRQVWAEVVQRKAQGWLGGRVRVREGEGRWGGGVVGRGVL